MRFFACDLDNTLIHSYKRAKPGNVCVEKRFEKELSYMTERAYDLLPLAAELMPFVPMTTRSLEQYRRIHFFQDKVPDYALVANGGLLLVNDIIDNDWLTESKKIIAHTVNEMEKAIGLLKKDMEVSFEVRLVDDLFVFTKSDNAKSTMNMLIEQLDSELVTVLNNGTKIYVNPVCMNKGASVKRFAEQFGFTEMIGAGDSLFDIPMLQYAKRAYVPSKAFGDRYLEGHPHVVAHHGQGFFGEFILEDILMKG